LRQYFAIVGEGPTPASLKRSRYVVEVGVDDSVEQNRGSDQIEYETRREGEPGNGRRGDFRTSKLSHIFSWGIYNEILLIKTKTKPDAIQRATYPGSI
jgi:hypothetical protein